MYQYANLLYFSKGLMLIYLQIINFNISIYTYIHVTYTKMRFNNNMLQFMHNIYA